MSARQRSATSSTISASAPARSRSCPNSPSAAAWRRASASPTRAEAEKRDRTRARGSARVSSASGEPDYPLLLRGTRLPAAADLRARRHRPCAAAGCRHRRRAQCLDRRAEADGAHLPRDLGEAGLRRRFRPGARHRRGGARGSLPTGTVAVLAGGLDSPIPPEHARLAQEIIGEWRGAGQRNADRLGAARAGFSAPQPASSPACRSGVRGGGGGEALRFADHGAACRRDGTRGVCRSRLAARSARRGHEPPHQEGATLVTCTADITRRAGADRRVGAAAALRRARGSTGALRDRSAPAPWSERGHAPDDRSALGPSPSRSTTSSASPAHAPAKVQMILLELDLAGRLERHRRQSRFADLVAVQAVRRSGCV